MSKAANSPSTSPSATVPPAAGTFSPLRPSLRLDNHNFSPTALQMIAEAFARLQSGADAAFALHLAGVEISSRHAERIALEVGAEMAQSRGAGALEESDAREVDRYMEFLGPYDPELVFGLGTEP